MVGIVVNNNNNSNNSVMTIKKGPQCVRRRWDATQSFVTATTILVSLSAAAAFQSTWLPLGHYQSASHRRHSHTTATFSTTTRAAASASLTKSPDFLVQDKDLFLRKKKEAVGKKRKANKSLQSLEEVYFSSPDYNNKNDNNHYLTARYTAASSSSQAKATPLVPLRRPKQISTRPRKRTSPTLIKATAMALSDGYQLDHQQNDIQMPPAGIAPTQTTTIPTTTIPKATKSTQQQQQTPTSNVRAEVDEYEKKEPSALSTKNAIQFKTTRKRRRATIHVTNSPSSAPPPAAEAVTTTTTTSPKGSTRSAKAAATTTRTAKSNRKSSTMPGFINRALTGKEQAFRDGLRLAELRSGKNIRQVVDADHVRKHRRKHNGESMYKNSASVPDSLVKFANEIHDEDRITVVEEKELGVKTQEALKLQNLYDNLVSQLDRDPTDEEWCAAAGKINMESIRQTIQDGIDAKNKLVTANLRMVQACVNLYIRNGLGGQYNAGDMMQEGIMALIRAAEKFEPDRGFRFSTYAMYWIRSAVKRSQIFQSRVITVPQRMYENHKRVMRVRKELHVLLKRPPTNQELGDAVGMSPQQIERCLDAMAQQCVSLDQSVTNRLKPMSGDERKGDSTMLDFVEGSRDDGEYQKQSRTFLKEDLIEAMKRFLNKEEVNLLLLRYGLVDESEEEDYDNDGNQRRRRRRTFIAGPKSIAEVSDLVGLKPDKVRRIIDKSLKQLKEQIGDEWRDFERELQ